MGTPRRDPSRPALASQGQTTEARDLLAPVYGWLTEGFDTTELKEAKGMPDELS